MSRKSCSLSAPVLVLCVAAVTALVFGCAHPEGEAKHTFIGVFTPKVPPFLNGPMAVLLTNAQGFTARVALESESSPEPPHAKTGQLLCRGSKLLYAPDPDENAKKQSRAGGFTFLWDAAENQGYLLSEALQGYAPIMSHLRVTNVVTGMIQATPRKVAGYQCEPGDARIQMSDAGTAVFQVWRATELKGLPVQISSATEPPVTLALSKIRLETPPADLFTVPDGFTKYSSPENLADELALRQNSLRRQPHEPAESLDHNNPQNPARPH
jgi:hypothetical protein